MSSHTWYRRSLWQYKGNREYTKSGYNLAQERFNQDELDVDCSDRHYVITGSNSGIGLEIAREVAKRGGVLHMVCRNFESAKKARSDIITTTGNDKIHLHNLDLAKPRDVAAWAREFVSTHEKIHVLVNNAGCIVREQKFDEDGIETNFAVNTLAVHILTMTLLPVMQKNEDARVITVSSAGMLVVRLDPLDLMHEKMQPYNGTLVYSQNKRQQVVMTLWYAQRYDRVHFSVMHPGWADTPSVRNSLPQFYEAMKNNLRTPAEGADTAIWLAISKAALKYPSGFFFQDREPASTHLPLAWTKTSIEEENLLMQKLMVLAQNVSSQIPQDEVKENTTDTISALNSHPPVTGVISAVHSNGTNSSKVEELSTTLSAVSISKSDKTEHPNNVDHISEIMKPVSKEPSPEREVSTPEELKEPVLDEKVETPTPLSIQTDAEVLSKEPSCEDDAVPDEVNDSAVDEVEDPVSSETAVSPQPDETKEESLSRTTSLESKEPEPTTDKVNEEPVPEATINDVNEEPVPEPTTDKVNEEPVPESATDKGNEEPVPEPTTDKINEEPVPEPTTDEINKEPVPEPTTDKVNEEPVPKSETDVGNKESVPEPTTDEVNEEQVPEPTTAEIKGEPVIEKLISDVNDTASVVSQTVSETQVQKTLETSSQNEFTFDETEDLESQESSMSLKSSDEVAVLSISPTNESLSENSPSSDIASLKILKEEEEEDTSSKISDMKTPEEHPVSPSESGAAYQSAASVVEHLIDITAEKAAASISS